MHHELVNKTFHDIRYCLGILFRLFQELNVDNND